MGGSLVFWAYRLNLLIFIYWSIYSGCYTWIVFHLFILVYIFCDPKTLLRVKKGVDIASYWCHCTKITTGWQLNICPDMPMRIQIMEMERIWKGINKILNLQVTIAVVMSLHPIVAGIGIQQFAIVSFWGVVVAITILDLWLRWFFYGLYHGKSSLNQHIIFIFSKDRVEPQIQAIFPSPLGQSQAIPQELGGDKSDWTIIHGMKISMAPENHCLEEEFPKCRYIYLKVDGWNTSVLWWPIFNSFCC